MLICYLIATLKPFDDSISSIILMNHNWMMFILTAGMLEPPSSSPTGIHNIKWIYFRALLLISMDVFSERVSRNKLLVKEHRKFGTKLFDPSLRIFSFAHFSCYRIIIKQPIEWILLHIYVVYVWTVWSQVPKADEIEYVSIPRNLIDCRNYVTQTALTYPNISNSHTQINQINHFSSQWNWIINRNKFR